jgi:hypothetical protein
MVAGMVTFKIAPGRLDRIIDRIRAFAGRTTNVAFVAVPSAPHRPGFAFFDVYRIPDTPLGVIVLMDFLNRHRTSFRLNLTFASNLGAYKFTVHSSQFTVCGSARVGVLGRFRARAFGNGTRLRQAYGVASFMRRIGLMNGNQQLLTGNGERRTANGELRTAL